MKAEVYDLRRLNMFFMNIYCKTSSSGSCCLSQICLHEAVLIKQGTGWSQQLLSWQLGATLTVCLRSVWSCCSRSGRIFLVSTPSTLQGVLKGIYLERSLHYDTCLLYISNPLLFMLGLKLWDFELGFGGWFFIQKNFYLWIGLGDAK